MSDLIVEGGQWLQADGQRVPCVIGRGGLVAATDKREGDGATPIGTWPLREMFYRADRIEAMPAVALPKRAIDPLDGWCDAPGDPHYNQMIRHPYPVSAEHLWRDDHLYDVIVVLGFNDAPPVPGHGSAIFFHLMSPDRTPTQGCVAVEAEAMIQILPLITPESRMVIRAA
ncbi:MAG: L,D-transpeptidase [Alphaproteobacteria bacterium]